ncbi:MAG: hypothetical protein QFX35_00825 [Candidatus Verstraetearchaeota archaeon]|nr:hypothetical protein [Candidatus Verstraetearchaeota archaeon]
MLGAKKYFLFPLVAIPVAMLVMNGLNFYLRTEIQPSSFAFLEIECEDEAGQYRVTFALLDLNGTNGPANGYAIIRIDEGEQGEIYKSELRVGAEEFHEVVSSDGRRMVGYSLIFKVPDMNSTNCKEFSAEVTFLSLFGNSITKTVSLEVP